MRQPSILEKADYRSWNQPARKIKWSRRSATVQRDGRWPVVIAGYVSVAKTFLDG
jgi:hypothetical protein